MEGNFLSDFLKSIIIYFVAITQTGCQVDSTFKKQLPLKQQIVSQSVTNNYNPNLDILFIIDNSGSMKDIQELLAKNAKLFINEFLDVGFIDYHIAVTTSSLTSGTRYHSHIDRETLEKLRQAVYGGSLSRCDDLAGNLGYDYPNYVDRNTPKADQCLSEMMNVGTFGSDIENFFNIPSLIFSDLMLQGKYPLFYRPEAHLVVFIITNGNDNSDFTPRMAYDSLLYIKGDERKIHYAAGIVNFQVLNYDCKKEDPPGPPLKIMKMVGFFGSRGYWFNLCRFNYGKILSGFANHLLDSVLTLPLDRIPDIDTLEVSYNYKGKKQVIPSEGWSYDVENNTIHLSRDIQLNQAGGEFDVKYELLYTSEL